MTNLECKLVLLHGVEGLTLTGHGCVEGGGQGRGVERSVKGGAQLGGGHWRVELVGQLLLKLGVELTEALLTVESERLVEVLLLAKHLSQEKVQRFGKNGHP